MLNKDVNAGRIMYVNLCFLLTNKPAAALAFILVKMNYHAEKVNGSCKDSELKRAIQGR